MTNDRNEQMETAQTTESRSLDELFGTVDEIIRALESGETSLEESFVKYQQGMLLLKQCSETIDGIEKQVMLINNEGVMSPFEQSAADTDEA